MRIASVLAALMASACSLTAGVQPPRQQSLDLHDSDRARTIPVEFYFPAPLHRCTRERSCPVAFISPGYGLPHTGYSFVAEPLTRTGHLVVAIRHDLPSDPALATTGNLFEARSPIWKRGADNLRFVRDALSQAHPEHDWANLTLIGHSNGGDLSALALHQSPRLATTLITLDHRRHPLPRDPSIRVLSIRGSDFEADPRRFARQAGTSPIRDMHYPHRPVPPQRHARWRPDRAESPDQPAHREFPEGWRLQRLIAADPPGGYGSARHARCFAEDQLADPWPISTLPCPSC